EYIGDKEPAQKLKDDVPKDPKKFFDLVVRNMKKLYKKGLIHGDLSDFNILNYHQKPVFIDFSQGTTADSPNADELLERDVRNICNFFRRHINVDEKKTLEKIKK
ncbi:MAG: RIO1 family regulatory kinase/ATPase, partial [archaeon]